MRHTLLILLALVAAPLVAGSHTPVGRCDSYFMLGVYQVGDGNPERTVYVDDRNFLLGNGIWVYQESNGIFTPYAPVTVSDPGPPQVFHWWDWVDRAASHRVQDAHDNLQRGGPALVGDSHEICTDNPFVVPDTLLF